MFDDAWATKISGFCILNASELLTKYKRFKTEDELEWLTSHVQQQAAVMEEILTLQISPQNWKVTTEENPRTSEFDVHSML